MRVKLINLNIWNGGKRLWDNVVQYLEDEQPDIVMLQEVLASEDKTAAPYLRTVESLQKILGYPYTAHAIESILNNGEVNCPAGNAILSRLPLRNPKIVWLYGSAGKTVDDRDRSTVPDFPRNLLHCEIEVNGQTYNLMNTHGVWAPDHNETDRQKEMGRKIADYVSGKPRTILTGDFNVNEGSQAIANIEQHLVNLFKGERVSSFNMKQKTDQGYATAIVDFIFASADIKVAEHRTSEANVSDHQSQVAVFEL